MTSKEGYKKKLKAQEKTHAYMEKLYKVKLRLKSKSVKLKE